MAGVMLSAQAPAPAAPAAPPPQTASDQPTFRGGVTLVTTDVIPRDSTGRFVSDLTKDDFTITEDGQPQTLASFVLVNGGRVFNLLEPPPVTASSNEGIVLPPQRRSADMGSGRVLLVFVDDLHFEANYTPHVRRIVQQIAETLMHDGDLVGMVSSGPSAHRDQPDAGPQADRRLGEQDSRLGDDAGGDVPAARVVAGAGRPALSRAGGVPDHVQHGGFARSGPEPPQGHRLHQLGLRLRSLRRGTQLARPHPGRALLRSHPHADRSGESLLPDGHASRPTSSSTAICAS